MSHIPSNGMPHALAHEDDQAQPAGARPEPDPTTATPKQSAPVPGGGAVPSPLAGSATDRAQDIAAASLLVEDRAGDEPPLSSAGPGTATGNRAGSDADVVVRAAGGAATGDWAEVDGTVTARDDHAPDKRHGRSRALTAVTVGGLAVLVGLVAAVSRLVRVRDEQAGRNVAKRRP